MIINVILFTILIVMIISTIVLFPDFKYYKKGYNILKTDTLYKDIWGDYSNKNKTFTWFKEGNDFMISKSVYLSNFSITYLSPYSLYWLIKYQTYMKYNKKINNILG